MSPPHAEASRIHAWLDARAPWQRRGLALAAGAAATLAHAPFHFTPLFAGAFVLLVWLIDGAAEKPRPVARGFALGWLFGLGHLSTSLYWVSSAFMVDAVAWGPLWGVPAALGLAAGLALFFGIGAAAAMALWTKSVRRLAWFAACMFAAEFARGHAFGGFPWVLPGYIWAPGGAVSQLASVIGIYGLSLLTLLVAVAPAAVADRSAGQFVRFAPLLASALTLGLVWGWGAQRLAAAQPADSELPIVRVAESGLSQAEKWRAAPDHEWRVLQRYLEASGEADESRADVLIWPEGAIPVVNFFMLENPAFVDALGRALGGRALIVGLTRRELNAQGEVQFRNSAAVIDGVRDAAEVRQIYDKHRLVPFGEFIPLWSLVSSLNIAPLQRIGAGFEPGEPPQRLLVPEAPPAVVLICYEAIFPGLTPRGEGRPGWIVSVTNDAWFGDGSGPYQHYAMARYRAIEEGLPMARAASGGISAVLDAYGREQAATGRGQGYAEARLPPALPETIFAKYGKIILAILLVSVIVLRFVPTGRKLRGG